MVQRGFLIVPSLVWGLGGPGLRPRPGLNRANGKRAGRERGSCVPNPLRPIVVQSLIRDLPIASRPARRVALTSMFLVCAV